MEEQLRQEINRKSDESGTEKHLFFDDRMFPYCENAELMLGIVKKDDNNPLFTEEYFNSNPKKWEVRYDNGYPNIIYDTDEGIYKCWYNLFIRDNASESTPLKDRPYKKYTDIRKQQEREMGVCYSVSKDGIHWIKPMLHLVEFSENYDNNLVMRNAHGAGVFKDVQDSNSLRRYKMFFKDGEDKNSHMSVAFSQNGLSWSNPVPWPKYNPRGDCHNNVFRDSKSDKYIGITRLWKDGIRVVGRSESADFVHWSEPVEVLRGTDESNQIYSMLVFEYFGTYIGLISVFHTGDIQNSIFDTVSCELAWSSDTFHWHRICPGNEFIPRGRGAYPEGEYDCGCIFAAVQPLIENDELLIYYMGSNGLHTDFREGSFNRVHLRQDGFAGYEVKNRLKKATIMTRLMKNNFTSLKLNADIAQGGYVKAAIKDENRNEIAGYRIDECDLVRDGGVCFEITWNGKNIRSLLGKYMFIEFHFFGAKLYSLLLEQ